MFGSKRILIGALTAAVAVCAFIGGTSIVKAACPIPNTICSTTPTQCTATGQNASDCTCVSVSIGITTIDRCNYVCPKGPGYFACDPSTGNTCDPEAGNAAVYCESRGWKWKGPGNPASCPCPYACANDTPPATYKSDLYHASCR